MYAAVLGQCGPRVPRFKSLFHSSRYSDDISFLGEYRQAELQSIWQEIGVEKYQKLEELRQMVSAAVDEIYETALEECEQRKAVLQEMVLESEIRLNELLGPNAVQAIAPKESSLQVRLNVNTALLHELDNGRMGGYDRVGGLVAFVELRHGVAALREMLNLPQCDSSADLEEVLLSTTEALHNLCPGRIAAVPVFLASESERKPIFQRLQGFHQTLCALESVWIDSYATKDLENKYYTFFHGADTSPQLRLQELEEMKDAREKNLDVLFQGRDNSPSTTAIAPIGCTIKRSSSKFRNMVRESKQVLRYSKENSALEQLSHNILKKLEDINRQVKCTARPIGDIFSPYSSYSQSPDIDHSLSSQSSGRCGASKGFGTMLQSASVSPSSEDNGASTPTSVLPETAIKTLSPTYHLSVGVSSSLWAGAASGYDKPAPANRHSHHHQDQSVAFNMCWGPQNPNDSIKNDTEKEDSLVSPSVSENVNGNNPSESFSIGIKNDTVINESQNVTDSPCERWPLPSITNNQRSHLPLGRKTSLLPPPPPPPPPPLPPPPPPPPPPPKTAQPSKSAKLKRSATLGKLYMEMKRKVEGTASGQAQTADVALPRRSIFGASTGEGMAEALAEITRRSSYFRKIEDDVKQHATSLLEVKLRLESFETYDMQKLLRFHESIEARLELLTDESQVLARFEGFPVKKLETVRAAASLYLRLSSLVQQIQHWPVEPPVSEQLEKVTSFFDKVKTDIGAVDRTKDEDLQRFINQKIQFNFGIVDRIKEATVDLSSRCLALALEESKRTKANFPMDDDDIPSKHMNTLRHSFQMLWKVFQLAFQVHNFAGGQDDKAEQLSADLAHEMKAYPSNFWLELVNK